MQQIFEVGMLVCFGLSWPFSVYKSWKSRTAKGRSIVFSCLIELGYVCGILNKVINHSITYVLAFYIFNLVLVFMDILLCLRNRKLDQLAEAK